MFASANSATDSRILRIFGGICLGHSRGWPGRLLRGCWGIAFQSLLWLNLIERARDAPLLAIAIFLGVRYALEERLHQGGWPAKEVQAGMRSVAPSLPPEHPRAVAYTPCSLRMCTLYSVQPVSLGRFEAGMLSCISRRRRRSTGALRRRLPSNFATGDSAKRPSTLGKTGKEGRLSIMCMLIAPPKEGFRPQLAFCLLWVLLRWRSCLATHRLCDRGRARFPWKATQNKETRRRAG